MPSAAHHPAKAGDGQAAPEVTAVPGVLPYNMADATLVPSAPASPTRSVVEVTFNTVTVVSGPAPGESEGGERSAAPGTSEGAADGAAAEPTEAEIAAANALHIDRRPAIIGYFMFMFGGGISVFYSQIFHDKGFEAYEIGILVASNPLLSMTLLPLLSYLADKFRCETKMIVTCIIICVITTFGLTLADSRIMISFYFLVMTASFVVMEPLLDQRTLMMFPKAIRSSSWGYVRSFGAYGWGAGCLVASLLYTWTGAWVAVAAQFMVGELGLAYCMIKAKPYENMEKVPVRFMDVLRLLATNKRVSLFIFASTMMGTGYSFINNFLFLFLNELGGSKFLMGLTVVLTVSTEIPLFQMSERLLDKLSERTMMTIAMSVWTFRIICYSLLTNPWIVLLIEPLHGVTFAFMWLPSVHLIARAFPPKLSSSATGVLFTFVNGVGPMIGNLVAGALYSLIGPRKMFLCAAVTMALALAFYLGMDHFLEYRGVPVVCDYDAEDTKATEVTVEGEENPASKTAAKEAEDPANATLDSEQAESASATEGRRAVLNTAEEELPARRSKKV